MRRRKNGLYIADGAGAADETLQRAVWDGDCPRVFLALNSGVDANSRGVNSDPLLVVAAYRGHLRIMQALLDHGAEPSASTVNGPALAAAIRSGHTRVAFSLLKSGALPKWQDAHLAALCGRARLLKAFLSGGTDVNQLEGIGGTAAVTLIMSAAFAGETDIIRVLIECGADVNLSNENGWTALLSAASCGHVDVVKLLLSIGADANAAAGDGDTPMTVAAKEGHDEVVRLLKEMRAAR